MSVVVRVFVAFASGRGKNTIDDDLGERTQGWGGVMPGVQALRATSLDLRVFDPCCLTTAEYGFS